MAIDDAEWRRIVAGSGVEDVAERMSRSAGRAESTRNGLDRLERAGRSPMRMYAEILASTATGQTGRELRNLVRSDDHRRTRAAVGRSRTVGTDHDVPTGSRLAQATVAVFLAILGPALLYADPRGPGYVARVDDVGVWAGVIALVGALWFTFIEPRRAGPRWTSAGLYMILAVVTAVGFLFIVRRTVDGESLDPVSQGVAFTALLAAVVIYLVGFFQHRRVAREARASQRLEASVELDRFEGRLRDELRARRDRIPSDRWPDPVIVLGAIRLLVDRGQVEPAEAREMVREIG